ncbi:MAG: hypothetical protein UX28_C0001G0073 [Candidatus Pacebacteria bacterium GW2011_GWA1_46_10]|nr:MAG: hypothetical protein UX28_C0001G0073 [Candidatus Pacebacteria bacterium GW2011_GWA1_46_10]HCR81711.1 hypothetical protein [Candidatus Paceibacterota bacterium]
MPDIFTSPAKTPASPHKTPTTKLTHIGKVKKSRSVDEYSAVMRKERPTRSHWRSYMPKPERTSFDTQTSDEQIILLLRPHPITLLKQVVIITVAVVLPLLSGSSFFTSFLPGSYILGLNLGWYLLTFSYALATFLIWFYSVFIITDERVIDVDFVSLLFKDVSSAKIDVIQDISSKTGGFLASVLDYGTVYIQTAGEQREIQFENIPHPARVAALLNELLLEEEREKAEGRVQ